MFVKFFGKKQSTDSISDNDGQLVHGIDPEMNFCPDCEVEFRGDVVKCPTCDVVLMTGEEKIQRTFAEKESSKLRTMDISSDDELVSIRKGPLIDIKALKRILAAEKIPSILAGDEASCGKGCCGPEMYLQIRREDMDAAEGVLAHDFVKNTALNIDDLKHADVIFDELAAETVCPACGCKFSPTVGACPECGLCFA